VRAALAAHVGERGRRVALAAPPRLGQLLVPGVAIAPGVAALAAVRLEDRLALLGRGAGHLGVALDLLLERLRVLGRARARRRVVAPLDEVGGDRRRLLAHLLLPLLVLGGAGRVRALRG